MHDVSSRAYVLRVPLLALLLVVAGAAAVPSLARAQPAGTRCLEKLTDAEVRARLDEIREALEQHTGPARRWWLGWMSGLSLVGVGQTIAAFTFEERGERATSALGAAGSLLSVIAMLVRPLEGVDAARKLRRLPDDTPAERRQKLRAAQRLLRESAESERRGSRWTAQWQIGAWVAATGLVLPLAFDEIGGWARLALGGLVVFETRTLTQPTGAIDDWEDYEHGSRPCMAPQLRQDESGPRVELAPSPGGLGIAVRF